MYDLALDIHGLEKSFPGFHLGPLTLEIPNGATYGFVGSNGSGKTTTLDLIMGMGNKDAGSILVFGMDHIEDEVAVKRRIGYVTQDLNFAAWGTIRRLIGFIRGFYPDWDNQYCNELVERLNLGWKDSIGTLSFGSRTKLNLHIALSHRPQLLLLDEPMAGLDAISKQEVFAELERATQEGKRTVLITSHNLDEIERYTTHVGMLDNGKLVLEGTTAGLLDRFDSVHCELHESATPEQLEGIYVVRRDNGRVHLVVDKTTNARDRLIAANPANFESQPASLEDIFVGVIKRAKK